MGCNNYCLSLLDFCRICNLRLCPSRSCPHRSRCWFVSSLTPVRSWAGVKYVWVFLRHSPIIAWRTAIAYMAMYRNVNHMGVSASGSFFRTPSRPKPITGSTKRLVEV